MAWATRTAVALLWLLHWLPLPVLALLGRGLGEAFYVFARARRNVVLTNLRLCFPGMADRDSRRSGTGDAPLHG